LRRRSPLRRASSPQREAGAEHTLAEASARKRRSSAPNFGRTFPGFADATTPLTRQSHSREVVVGGEPLSPLIEENWAESADSADLSAIIRQMEDSVQGLYNRTPSVPVKWAAVAEEAALPAERGASSPGRLRTPPVAPASPVGRQVAPASPVLSPASSQRDWKTEKRPRLPSNQESSEEDCRSAVKVTPSNSTRSTPAEQPSRWHSAVIVQPTFAPSVRR